MTSKRKEREKQELLLIAQDEKQFQEKVEQAIQTKKKDKANELREEANRLYSIALEHQSAGNFKQARQVKRKAKETEELAHAVFLQMQEAE